MALVSSSDLAALESAVEGALRSGDDAALRVLGYGEISLVLGWPAAAPVVACKRLPVFPSRERFESYAEAVTDCIAELRKAGVDVVETEIHSVERADGIAAYAVQPVYPASTLGVNVLAAADPKEGHAMVGAIIDTMAATIGPRLALDSQLSNWVWDAGRLRYLDITTPLFWSEDGTSRFDADLQLRALPWALRGGLRRFVVPGLLDRYRNLRLTYADLCGNLFKERLEAWIPAFLEAANPHVDPPITPEEVAKFYRSDARLWEILLRVRRLDRAWQRRVRRRPYQFLLPKKIER